MSERTKRTRYRNVTIEEAERLLNDYYLVAKCDIRTSVPSIPLRPSLVRTKVWKSDVPGRKRVSEHPNMDESTWEYPIGKFTTWVRTSELKGLLEKGDVDKIHEAIITFPGTDNKSKWDRLRRRVLETYGERCMRCGEKDIALEIDHIQKWTHRPDLRYDIDNLQVLCTLCHRWKTEQEEHGTSVNRLDFKSS